VLAPVFGALGDRQLAARLIAWVWPARVSPQRCRLRVHFLTTFAARAAVGVGEAAYVTIAPSLPLGVFPVGSGPGHGDFFARFRWDPRWATGSEDWSTNTTVGVRHFVAVVPGLLLAACACCRDPPRGIRISAAALVRRETSVRAPASDARPWKPMDACGQQALCLTVMGYAA